MKKQTGIVKDEFLDWLEKVNGLLPSKMPLQEAMSIFLRRKQEKVNETKSRQH